jgi:hypothetical protein
LQQLRQLGREIGISGDLELAAEQQLHGGLPAAVDHRAGKFRELEAALERALMLYRKGQSIGAAEIEAALATAS